MPEPPVILLNSSQHIVLVGSCLYQLLGAAVDNKLGPGRGVDANYTYSQTFGCNLRRYMPLSLC